MRLTREVKTGILAIGAILLFIFGYSFLKGTNLLQDSRYFYVKYKNVEGLAKSAPVTINGLNVGKVNDINFANNTGGLVVKFTLDDDFVFSRDSKVRIYSAGLISGKSLGIFPEYDVNNIAKSGDTLSGEIEGGMLDAVTKALGPLEKKVNVTLATLDTVLIGVSDILDEETRVNLKDAIKNLNATMSSFNGASSKLNTLLANNTEKLDRTFTNLDDMSSNFSKLSDSLAQLETGKLVTDLQHVISKLDGIATGIDNGEGSVGKLLKDDALYNNLEGASKQLEQLLQDVKLNPKRYVHISVFGKKQKEYTTPEDPNQ
ncbi:MlaD family protein [Ulvibacter litoralis]|uniref:Phospholipid/cholesterol/gamma-HCH transport system substrate-binding protein n=1 Tax=Ulvibacter litoralis TaxID=227084 RepID=A0A1G7FQL3_9FLAO|nr:MlaD family protein [Ulvibacter litoralis]GHC50135.1 organic solvent ABC transporter substrate-binding protein [Ulvibacter litoralis]SDE78226.1 phospholipid/cholesterol/gamma-HCH transport system substrate-binding protein [Ulvibacter litoralis]